LSSPKTIIKDSFLPFSWPWRKLPNMYNIVFLCVRNTCFGSMAIFLPSIFLTSLISSPQNIFGSRQWSYYSIQWLDLVLIESIFHWNHEYRNMWSFDQAKFALILVQKWPYQNEVIDLFNKQKNFNKLLHQDHYIQIHSNISYPKKANRHWWI
jgi:hypothetical protein